MRHLYSKCGDGVCYCWQWGLEGRLNAIGFPRSDDPEAQARDDAALARQRERIIYVFTGSWRLSEEAAALPPEVLRSLQEQALAKARTDWPSREPSQWTTRIVSVRTREGRVSATVEVWGRRHRAPANVEHPSRPPRRRPSWYL